MCGKCYESDAISQAWRESCMMEVVEKRRLEAKVKKLEDLVKRIIHGLVDFDELTAKEAKKVLDEQ